MTHSRLVANLADVARWRNIAHTVLLLRLLSSSSTRLSAPDEALRLERGVALDTPTVSASGAAKRDRVRRQVWRLCWVRGRYRERREGEGVEGLKRDDRYMFSEKERGSSVEAYLTLAFFLPSGAGGPPNAPILIAREYLPCMPGPSHPNGSLSQNASSASFVAPPGAPLASQKTYRGRARRMRSPRGEAPLAMTACGFSSLPNEGERSASKGGGAWRRRMSRPVATEADLKDAREGAAVETGAPEGKNRWGEARIGARREGERVRCVVEGATV